MPIHGTMLANSVKEHDNLHQLFMDGVLSSCWCLCQRCWQSQLVYGICRFDPHRGAILAATPMRVTDEDRRRCGTYRPRVSNYV
jgi:hypothetical protein